MVLDYTRPDESALPSVGDDDKWGLTDYRIQPPQMPKPAYSRAQWHNGQEADLDRRAARQPVLLVRTGDDGHLSAPISFQPLFDSHRALPMTQHNAYDPWEDIVRVRLDHALDFIEGLIRREEAALPHVRQASEALEREVDELCGQWIERVLKHAAEVGFDNNGFVWQASRRALARLNGEAFDLDQVAEFHKRLRMWLPGIP